LVLAMNDEMLKNFLSIRESYSKPPVVRMGVGS
jgi:hypothetical protein